MEGLKTNGDGEIIIKPSWLTFFSFILVLLSVVISIAVYGSTARADINALKAQVEDYKLDHDKITVMETKLDSIQNDVQEIKSDLKELIKNADVYYSG